MSSSSRKPSSGARARSDLENRALLSARALVDRMRSLYRELERKTGAPITQHRALVCIGAEPGITASVLADKLGMQRPAVSHVLRNLEAQGWVERRRSPNDQRSVRIHVTDEGQKLLNATAGSAVGTLQRAVKGIDNDELEQLATGLEALLAQLNK
jgi:DNA-binding MarR family transcriptional regulator